MTKINTFFGVAREYMSMWYKALCPFEGPTDEGQNVDILVELTEDEDFDDLWRRIREYSEYIDDFYEHSVQEELTREVGELADDEVQELVEDMFEPDYAVFADGRVYYMQYIDDGRWANNSS